MKRTDFSHLRRQLANKQGREYWRCLEELADSEHFRTFLTQEFPRFRPLWDSHLSRRNALKLMAASMALAGISACGRQPEEELVPYVNQPEHVVPGKPTHYATASVIGGYGHGLLAESHEGRPTKLEGNPEHPATLGACDIYSQASVLSLYDPDRSDSVMHGGNASSYDSLLAELANKQHDWDKTQGKGLALLTGAVTSPSQYARLRQLFERWPRATWHVHEPVDRSAVYAGTEQLFGQPLEAVYDFSTARIILSLDADFMQGQPGFLRYAHDFSTGRRPRDTDQSLNRLYTIESTPGITGAVADHRFPLAYPHIEMLARRLARFLDIQITDPDAIVEAPWLEAIARDLDRHHGAAVVVPGDQQPAAVHALAHAINHRLNAFGNTVHFIEPVDVAHQAQPLETLVESMKNRQVQDLIVLDANPAYTAPADLDFASAYRHVPWQLHWGNYYDETARLSRWHVPATHPLESWADVSAHDGTVSLIQPLIEPLHDGKTVLQILTAITEGKNRKPRELLRDYWHDRHEGNGFEQFWWRSLNEGLVADTAAAYMTPQPRHDWQKQLPSARPARQTGSVILQLRPDPALWDGRYANNGWLQELPRPLTKLTWDNALVIAPALAESHNLAEGDMVRLQVGQQTLEIPVYILPGQPADAVTMHLGHGRSHAGRIAEGVGSNAYALRNSQQRWATPVSLSATGRQQPLAVTQQHHAIEGRDLLRVGTVSDYRQNPGFAQSHEPQESLYPESWPAVPESDHAWGMVVDLSACIGCNACVTACQAENNIPIVGAEEVRHGHEMHWIRVDRYFEGPLDTPRMAFQPVPCMHCENAPCEYVCPVAATQHSADGLNEMIYNRCIGTRYCSQNCPYKVRRFNWFDYTSAEADYPAEPAVQNPDVTVRSRGVMEKCTYCVQRINATRNKADAENRPIRDGELMTACQQACPTSAIVFGDLADQHSEVSRLREHPLNYAMLSELNTRPRTTYLAAVRNPNPEIEEF